MLNRHLITNTFQFVLIVFIMSFICSCLTGDIFTEYHWNMVLTDSTKTINYDTISDFKNKCLDIQCRRYYPKSNECDSCDQDSVDCSVYFDNTPIRLHLYCSSMITINNDTIKPMTDLFDTLIISKIGKINIKHLDVLFDSNLVCISVNNKFYLDAREGNDTLNFYIR